MKELLGDDFFWKTIFKKYIFYTKIYFTSWYKYVFIYHYIFQAALGQTERNGDIKWLCNAVLISPEHLLTAAHCVTGG